MNKKIYIKAQKTIYRNTRNKPIFGLSRSESYTLEKKCLIAIKTKYKCICGHGITNPHFPTIVNHNDHTMTLNITWAGQTVKHLYEKGQQIIVPDMDAQIKCIIKNLNEAEIYHLDMHRSGKNLCIKRCSPSWS